MILVSALNGEKTERIPFWFMRQAGRYLPEYKKLRGTTKDFLSFCYSPEIAVEATLQPIHRFGMDGAIIFSDILVIPHALGMDVRFEEGVGPILAPVRTMQELQKLSGDALLERLSPVYEALSLARKKLSPEKALIGFAGAPWTLACYVIEGRSGSDFNIIKSLCVRDRVFFSALIELLTKSVIEHVKQQIKAGADIIQIFDSWAGILDEQAYNDWVIAPTKKILSAIKQEFPHIPLIGFPRQSGSKFLSYVKETHVDSVNVDDSVPLNWVKKELQPLCIVQGNLDPLVLAGDKNLLLKEAEKILSQLDKPFVFNLGHGILPHTPIENMQALCDFLRGEETGVNLRKAGL